ncbi:MAG: hypothetical protein ACK2UW_23230, partial [Anaerolineales bacterium]
MRKLSVVSVILAVVVLGSMILAACQPAAPELGTEENPIIWAVVPSGETERVVSGFDQVAAQASAAVRPRHG